MHLFMIPNIHAKSQRRAKGRKCHYNSVFHRAKHHVRWGKHAVLPISPPQLCVCVLHVPFSTSDNVTKHKTTSPNSLALTQRAEDCLNHCTPPVSGQQYKRYHWIQFGLTLWLSQRPFLALRLEKAFQRPGEEKNFPVNRGEKRETGLYERKLRREETEKDKKPNLTHRGDTKNVWHKHVRVYDEHQEDW